MKKTIIAIAAFISLGANALELEIGIGQTRSTPPPNTQYYQKEFPHSFDMIAPAYYVGATGMITPWLRGRVGWLDLGNVRTEAYATSDVNYQEGVGCINPCPILGKWDVYSRTKGVEFSVAPEMQIGQTTAFLKLGVLVHRPRVDVYIYRYPGDTARTHFNYPEQLNYAPTIGFGGTWKNATVSLSFYKIDATTDTQVEEDRMPPPYGSRLFDTAVLMGAWRF